MSFRKLFLLIFFTVMMNGCAAPQIVPEGSTLDVSNSAVLYISRAAHFVNAGVGYRIFINGDYIGEIWGGGVISRSVHPGKTLIEFKPYSFGIPDVGAKKLDLDLEIGHEYHVSMGASLNGIVPIGSVIVVDRSMNIQVAKKKIEP